MARNYRRGRSKKRRGFKRKIRSIKIQRGGFRL